MLLGPQERSRHIPDTSTAQQRSISKASMTWHYVPYHLLLLNGCSAHALSASPEIQRKYQLLSQDSELWPTIYTANGTEAKQSQTPPGRWQHTTQWLLHPVILRRPRCAPLQSPQVHINPGPLASPKEKSLRRAKCLRTLS